MAETADRDEKTESPTELRKRDARDKGDLLQSKEFGTALMMLAGAGWLILSGQKLVDALGAMLARGLHFDRTILVNFDLASRSADLLLVIALPTAALLGVTLLAAFAAPTALGSLGFRSSAFAFKPNRINPVIGLSRIFSISGLMELFKSILKILLLGAVGWFFLMGKLPDLLRLGTMDIGAASHAIGVMFGSALIIMALVLGLIAGVDVPSQLFQRQYRLRMTKQEIRDENKQSEGSPEVKKNIRQKQYALLNSSARSAVRDATVILVNPTQFAVALRYRLGKDAAPVVVARGRGPTAQAIRELANEAAIPVLTYPMLTRAIYYTSQTGSLIREDLFMAVAAILAFVFNLDNALGAMMVQPIVDVPPDAHYDEDGKAVA
jgi:flagellar biosynthesis protein FlhB